MAQEKRYRAVVIGASAGGLHALSYLLEGLPEAYPYPVIVVQHRIRDQQELLEELLQLKCRLLVKQADEKESVQQGVVYIAPPGYHLLIEKDKSFSLTVDNPVSFSRPSVDVLFETAAAAYGEGLVAIVLTGANKDGASGIKAVAAHGGLTVAQHPDEAQYPSMPAAAIATRLVRRICTLKEIRELLLKIAEE